jgi:folate-binding protein YgfZ
MQSNFEKNYNHIRSGGAGFYEQKRGLISVHGKEAIMFLDGMISNDMKTLEDGAQMLAAFPDAKGRLIATVRVTRQGEKFLFETAEETHKKVFDDLFRFTHAGDFFVEDLSENYRFLTVFDRSFIPITPPFTEFEIHAGTDYFVDVDDAQDFLDELKYLGAVEIDDELYETLRIENGIPKYGVDMDETTIVSELGIDGLISYQKGCYIGQEIIARIHFRGHVAKQLTGIILSEPPAVAGGLTQELQNTDLTTADGKNAGRITSVTYSPKLEKTIALAYVRYDHLADGTELSAGDQIVTVKNLPFV